MQPSSDEVYSEQGEEPIMQPVAEQTALENSGLRRQDVEAEVDVRPSQ